MKAPLFFLCFISILVLTLSCDLRENKTDFSNISEPMFEVKMGDTTELLEIIQNMNLNEKIVMRLMDSYCLDCISQISISINELNIPKDKLVILGSFLSERDLKLYLKKNNLTQFTSYHVDYMFFSGNLDQLEFPFFLLISNNKIQDMFYTNIPDTARIKMALRNMLSILN
jgi:hypothetical protein